MSRSSNNSLPNPSTSQSSGSLLLNNLVHVDAINNTSNLHNLSSLSSLEASGSMYSGRPVLSEAAVPRVLSQQQESFSQSCYINKTHPLFFPHLAAILDCTTCRTHAPCSFLRPVRASWVLLHHVLRCSLLSLPSRCTLVSSQHSVAGLPLVPPLGHDTRSPAPWQSNVGSTVSTAPGLAQSGTPYHFPLTMPRYLETRDPYPLLRLHLARLTTRW